jgi:segregation and condensation protein B
MENTEVQAASETEWQNLESVSEELVIPDQPASVDTTEATIKALVEGVIYITDEPLTADQIATALQHPVEKITQILDELTAEYNKPEHGLTVREIAGGYKMSTKPEHHEAIRTFVKNLNPPLKLSLAALETLALIAYKQPITAPEIMEVRGVQGAGVLKTLIDRKLIATSGRKQVLGKPILYKTTKEFLVQFGLKDLSELPTLKEFEELSRMSLGDPEEIGQESQQAEPPAATPEAASHAEPAADSNSDPEAGPSDAS